MSSKVFAFTNLTLAMVIVGSSVVFGKIITANFPVFLASGLRFAIASLMLLPIVLRYEKRLFKIPKKDIINLLLMAFTGQVIFSVFVLVGLRYTSAIEAGLITSTTPAMMAVVSFSFFREKPGIIQIVGICLVVVGVISINGVFNLESTGMGKSHIVGNLLMICAVVGEAFFLLMRKRISPGISNLALTGYLCFLGFFMFLPLSVYQAISFDFTSVSTRAWISIFYFGAVFTVLAYLFWFQGVTEVSGSVAGVFTAIMPVSAVALSCFFLKETFTLYHAFGGGLILLSIFLMAVNKEDVKALGIRVINRVKSIR